LFTYFNLFKFTVNIVRQCHQANCETPRHSSRSCLLH